MSKYYPRKGKISKHFRDARNLHNNYKDYKIIKNKSIILLHRFTVSWTGSFRHLTRMVVPLSPIPMLFSTQNSRAILRDKSIVVIPLMYDR